MGIRSTGDGVGSFQVKAEYLHDTIGFDSAIGQQAEGPEGPDLPGVIGGGLGARVGLTDQRCTSTAEFCRLLSFEFMAAVVSWPSCASHWSLPRQASMRDSIWFSI